MELWAGKWCPEDGCSLLLLGMNMGIGPDKGKTEEGSPGRDYWNGGSFSGMS